MTKAAVGSVAVALALDDDLLELDGYAAEYLPDWAGDPVKSRITVRQLGAHSSGIAHREDDGLAGWADAFWGRAPDLFPRLISDAPIIFEPGSTYHYSGPGWGVLSVLLARLREERSGETLQTVVGNRVMRPLGVPDDAWSLSYGTNFEFEGVTVHALWSGAAFQARALARIGELFVGGGSWHGRRLISAEAVREVTTYGGTALASDRFPFQPAPAVGWWSNERGAWPVLPNDAIAGAGLSGEILLIIPSEGLIMVRAGAPLTESGVADREWESIYRLIFVPFAQEMGI